MRHDANTRLCRTLFTYVVNNITTSYGGYDEFKTINP